MTAASRALVACAAVSAAAASVPGTFTFFLGSDTHLGHDVGNVTSLELNTNAVNEMNGLPGNASWPSEMGGGTIQQPYAVVITGDLVDNGYFQMNQWRNWSYLYGLDGTDGLLHYRVYEGRGNHDGGNSTDQLEPHFVASEIVARNQLRLGLPEFNITAISESGLHYAWAWAVSPTCTLHFVMMNEYAGHLCDGCAPNNCFYGPACYTGWTYPEDSLGFLQSYLAKHVNTSGMPVMAAQHYGFDGYSNTWYSFGQRSELYNTLSSYNTVAVWVGHTHVANKYQWNGTDTIGDSLPGGIDVYNVPSTQKEDNNGAPLPSEFMVAQVDVDGSGVGTLRVGQRVGFDAWGTVMAQKTFKCPA